VVVAAQLKRWSMAGAGVLAAAFIVAAALHGERPSGGVVPYEVKGFLAAYPADAVQEVEIESAAGRRVLRRTRDGWEGGANVATAVRLLHDTAPERNVSAEELAGARLAGVRLVDYGLSSPALVVTARGTLPPFRIAFGGPNPLGVSRYVQVQGREGIWLLPRHVAEAWEAVARAP
jgi:hypothetical protein